MKLKRCANCANGEWCRGRSEIPKVCYDCNYLGDGSPSKWKLKAVTNADSIRAMSDEELAGFLDTWGCCHHCIEHERLSDNRWFSDERCDEKCVEHCLEWLQQPAEVDNG